MSAKVGPVQPSRQTLWGPWPIQPIRRPKQATPTSALPKKPTAASRNAGSFRLAQKAVVTMAAAATKTPKTRNAAILSAAFLLAGGALQPFLQNPATPHFPTTRWQARLAVAERRGRDAETGRFQ